MSTQPEGEDLRKATKWISDQRIGDPGANLRGLIERASIKFDLSPQDTEFLTRFFAQKSAK